MDNQILWEIIGETLKARNAELRDAMYETRARWEAFDAAWQARDYRALADMGYLQHTMLDALAED